MEDGKGWTFFILFILSILSTVFDRMVRIDGIRGLVKAGTVIQELYQSPNVIPR